MSLRGKFIVSVALRENSEFVPVVERKDTNQSLFQAHRFQNLYVRSVVRSSIISVRNVSHSQGLIKSRSTRERLVVNIVIKKRSKK